MSFTGKLLSFASLSSLAASAAFAQSLPPSVAACADEKDSLARLVCFDREVAKFTQPAASVAPTQVVPPMTAPPTPIVVTTQPSSPSPDADDFGMNVAIARQREGGRNAPTSVSKEMHAVVAKVSTKPYGEVVLELDNGQVWEQPEVTSTFIIKAGENVVIRQAKLGSFLLRADSGATARVRRVR